MATTNPTIEDLAKNLPDWANKRPVSERYPDIGTGEMSIEPYISEDFFELEREKIFKKMWLYVGRVERIPKAGDYFTQVIEAVRTKKEGTSPSFIICRDNNGEVRAFYNTCMHRGTTVCQEQHECWENVAAQIFFLPLSRLGLQPRWFSQIGPRRKPVLQSRQGDTRTETGALRGVEGFYFH